MSESDRELLVRVHRDVEAALASARKLWGNDAGEETLLHTAEAYLVHLRELRRSANGGSQASAAPAAVPAEPPPACPLCQGTMRDQRATKRNPRQPDFKCLNRDCDGALWLDRKRRPATTTS